jgi:regulator of protease activity HflC (stomatin/prohibitin superfamily)
MQTRPSSASASLALALMFLSLLVIYLVVPQTGIVTTICVLILVLSLLMGLVGDTSDVRIMVGVAAVMSLLAAGFLGDEWLGVAGRILVPSIWFIFLWWSFRQLRANTLVIPEDHAVMYAPFLSSQVYQVDPGQTQPITVLDRAVATIPLYELTLDTQVKKVNTRGFHDIPMVEAHVRYRVTDPVRALAGIPNRGKIQNEVAREMGMSVARARLDVAFWEKLLARQMAEEVDDILRAVAFNLNEDGPLTLRDKTGAVMKDDDAKPLRGSMLESYLARRTLSEAVLSELRVLVSRWGVNVTHLDLDLYELDKDQIGKITDNPERKLAKEAKEKQAQADNDAYYVRQVGREEAAIEAQRMRAMIDALTERLGDQLSPAVIEEIVVTALRTAGNTPLREMVYPGLFDENRNEKPPASGSSSNGAKK